MRHSTCRSMVLSRRAPGSLWPSAGRQPRHSLHLTALVQLVKGIPEFLFGEVKGTEDSPESRGASLDGESASPEGKSVGQGGLRGSQLLHKGRPGPRPGPVCLPSSCPLLALQGGSRQWFLMPWLRAWPLSSWGAVSAEELGLSHGGPTLSPWAYMVGEQCLLMSCRCRREGG